MMNASWIRVVLMLSAWLLAGVPAGLHFYADVREQHVNIRWAPSLSDDDRLRLEERFGLIDGERRPERTWSYLLTDRSRANISALVTDANVEDTAHIDRSAFRVRLDRPDLPRWVVAIAETERLDTVGLIFGILAVIATWRCRSELRSAWTAGAERIRAVFTAGRSALGELWGAVSAAGFVLFRSARRAAAAHRRTAALAAVAVAFAMVFCWPLLSRFGRVGPLNDNDWDQHLTLHWVPHDTVTQYGEIPLWNPYVCGGMPMLGNPQSRWLSPFFLLHLLFGLERGLQLEMIAHVALAWLGALLLGRTAGLSWVASLAPAIIFAGSSWFYLHLAEGHTTWMAFAYTPGILAAAASNRPVLAGIGLALAAYEGGVYPVPYTVLGLALLALHRTIAERSVRPLAGLGMTAITAACVAAPKLLLMQVLMTRYPRAIESTESIGPELLTRALLGRNQDWHAVVSDDQQWSFLEYGAYVGPIAFALAVCGAIGAKRRAAAWIVLLGVGLALSVGGTLGGDYSPWAFLHQLPVFASLRKPSRFVLLVVLAIGMLAGLGVDRLVSGRGGWRMALAVALLVTATIDFAFVGPPQLQVVTYSEEIAFERSKSFVQLNFNTPKQMYAAAKANMGSVNCYEPLEPTVAPLGVNEPGYRGEQYLLREGTVRLVQWSPNRLTLDVSSSTPNVVVINYNYDAFWQVASGTGQTFDHEGLLGVNVPAGSQQIVLAYRSQRFVIGVLLAIGALTVAGVGARRRRSHRDSRERSAIDDTLPPPEVGPLAHF